MVYFTDVRHNHNRYSANYYKMDEEAVFPEKCYAIDEHIVHRPEFGRHANYYAMHLALNEMPKLHIPPCAGAEHDDDMKNCAWIECRDHHDSSFQFQLLARDDGVADQCPNTHYIKKHLESVHDKHGLHCTVDTLFA